MELLFLGRFDRTILRETLYDGDGLVELCSPVRHVDER